MLPVSRQFHQHMTADVRRTFGRVVIDYTNPELDQSIIVLANEQVSSLLSQVADGVTLSERRWASVDGTTFPDGNSFPAPTTIIEGQMGWWGSQIAGASGAFTIPFPTLIVTFAPRPIHSLMVVGDLARNEFAVDFEIRLLGAGGVVRHTRTVINNALIDWQETITPVTEITQYVLEIRRWSHVGRQAKILEMFTSIQEIYEGDDLLEISLLEERELTHGSLPVGNISANEISVKLDNSTRKFDAGNRQSPLYQLLVQNRRIRAWLGRKGEGHGVNMHQTVDFNTGTRQNLIVNAGRLELPTVSPPAFTRNSTAYLRNGTLVNANLPRFEAGRFGQAVMTEEGTTNIAPHSAYTNRTHDVQMVAPSWGGNAGHITYFSSGGFGNMPFKRFVRTAVGTGGSFLDDNLPIVIADNRTYIVSGWMRASRNVTLNAHSLNINRIVDNAYRVPLFQPVLTPQWQRFSWIYNAGVGHAGNYQTRHIVYSEGSVDGVHIEIDWCGFQVEEKSFLTSFINTDANPRARVGELLTVPTAGVVNPVEGSVEFIWQPINQPSSTMVGQMTSPQIIRMGTYHANNSWVLWVMNGELRLFVRGEGATGWTGNWTVIAGTAWYVLNRSYHIAVTWSGSNTFHVFVDGIQYGPFMSTHAFTGVAGNTLELGGSAASGHTNALYDDLRISNRARTLAEHQAAFNSGQPLVVDANTTYILRANGNLNHGQGGDYTSPEYDLSIVGTTITSNIAWQAPVDGVTRDVSARLDGQAWTPVINGGELPFTPGQLLTGRRLQLNVLLRRE